MQSIRKSLRRLRHGKRSLKLEALEPRNLLAITPIGYWSFDNAANVGEDHPLTGRNNHLTVNGNAAYTASSHIGAGALALDGVGDWLSRSAVAGLPSGNSPYTISAWVQPVGLTVTAARGVVGWGGYGVANRANALRLFGDNGIQNYWWPLTGPLRATDAQVTAAGVDLDGGAWHHVAATYNGMTRTLWLNGQAVVSDTPASALNMTTTTFRVGAACNLCSGNEAFNGRLDEVAVWNEALTSNNIQRLASGRSPLDLVAPGLAASWVADDLAATLADDAVVTTWTDAASGINAVATGQPTLQTNEINSHAVVLLQPADGTDLFRVIAADNPLSGEDDFSVAVVFRTSTTGTGGSNQWTENTGIIDASQPGENADWGLAINGSGNLGFGMGDPDLTTYTATNYADGNPHVAVLTRTGGVTTLYVDGGNGVWGDAGTAPRSTADLVFGALASGVNRFSGAIAEVQLWDVGMNAAAAYQLAAVLGNRYELDVTPPTTPGPAQLVGHWVADDLAAGAVSTWTSRVGTAVATVSASDPEQIPLQLRGHAVVQFDGDDALTISAADNPLAGAGDFTVFAVIRANTAGSAGTNWWQNSGIVDMDVPGDATDWGLVLDGSGRVGAGLGSAAGNNATLYSSTAGLNDGKAHILAMTHTGTSLKVFVDSAEVGTATGSAAARLANAIAIGRIQSGGPFFTGDVAEIRLYQGGMNATAVATVSAELSSIYRPLPNYRQTVLNHSPAHYYRLSEATSTVPAADEMGTNPGTYNGSPAVGQVGALPLDSNKAVQFDGSNDYVRINNTTALDFTLEAWIKTSAASTTGSQAYQGNGILWSDVGGGASDFVMAILNNQLSFFDGGSDSSANGTRILNNNQWHHIVAVRDGGGQNKIYVDGVLDGTTGAGNVVLSSNPNIHIGANTLDNRYFNGLIDEVAIYNRLLTDNEVLQHYQVGTALGTPPEALDDPYSATEDALLTVDAASGVLANDDSPENNPMTAILVAGAQHGTVMLAADGSFTYQPAANYSGPDSFTYRANDGIDSNVATVMLTVNPQYDAVVAFADQYVVDSTLANFSVTAPGLLANDVNVDGSPTTAQLVLDSTAGTLSLATNGSFVYQPEGIVGAQTFTYRVFDGTGNSNTVTVTLLVDTPPTADNDSYDVVEDQAFSASAAQGVLAGDADAESNPLTAVLVQGPTHGTLMLRTDGSFDYTPALNYFGPDSFTYRASDGDQQSAVATVSIAVAARNDAPVAVADAYFGFEGEMITRTATNGVLANDVDVDNTNLTATLITPPAFGTLLFNADGSLSYTAPTGFIGSTTFSYKTGDGAAESAPAIVTLVINSRSQQVVINEIHYDPADNTSRAEFIELYNAGNTPVDLSGWYFSDGIDFVIPSGTVIAPDTYILVAEDPATIQSEYSVAALGPWVGALSNDGEEVILRNALGDRVDRVDYGIGYPWPTDAAGGGGSMERIHPVLDGQLGGSWRTSSISSTLPTLPVYILPKSDPAWHYRKGTSEASTPMSAWRQPGFVEDGTWLTGRTPIGYGDGDDNTLLSDMQNTYSTVYLRHEFTLTEMPELLKLRVYVDDGAIVWINGVEFSRHFVSPGDKAFNALGLDHESSWVETVIDNPEAVFDLGVNTIAIHALNATLNSSDLSIDAELVIPGSGEAIAEPSPGRQNSVYALNAPPQTRQVDHTPQAPTTTQDTTITVRVSDPDGVSSVQLLYQVVLPGQYIPAFLPLPRATLEADPTTPRPANPAYSDPANWTTVSMYDDGTHGDAVIGDNLYSAVIPAQSVNRTLVRYRVRVEDTLGTAVTVPYNDDDSLNFAYYVYDGVPAYAGVSTADLTSLPVYSFLTRPADWTQVLAWTSVDQIPQGTLARFEYNWVGTMVYDGEVYDNISYRLRGANGRYLGGNSKRSMKFNFNKGQYFEAKDENGEPYPRKWSILTTGKGFDNRLTLTYALNEHINYYMWNQMGVPAPEAHYFHFRVVDGATEAPDLHNGDFWGLNWAQENYDVRFLEAHDLEKGSLYKLINQLNDPEQEIRYQGPDAVTDGSDYWNIENNLTGGSTTAFIQNNVNLDNWNRFHALAEAIRHYDYWATANKNFAWYFEPDYTGSVYGKMWSLPWDTDASWGPTWNEGHDVVYDTIFPSHPEFYPEYYNIVRELRDLMWQPDQINPMIDHFAAKIDQFIAADHVRWRNAPAATGNYNGLHGPGTTSLAAYVQDMKNFAFVGGNWDGGGVGAGGRAAYLDSHQAANGEGGQIPNTPTISYTGAVNFPADGLSFQTTPFSDPQGTGSFGAIQWRLASYTNLASPTYDPNEPFKLEYNADWDSGRITTFANSIAVPTSAVEVGKTYRARVRVQDSTGRWSHWSAPVQFTATTPQSVANLLESLRITEVMYNPLGTQDYEYIELANIGTQPLDLTDVRLGDGVDFTFTGSAVTTLAPGQHVVVVSNLASFRSRYGDGPLVAGVYDLNFSNAGEHVELTFGANTVIQEFTFDDAWHPTTDGDGYSLVSMNPADPNLARWNEATGWRPSFELDGSPGESDVLLGDLNLDGRVGLADLAILQANLGRTSGATPLQGDLNGDLAVNREDVARFVERYGRAYVPPVSPSSAPAAAVVTTSAPAATANAARVSRLSAQRIVGRSQPSDADSATTSTLRARRRPAPLHVTGVDQVFAENSPLPRRSLAHR
jgi:hypothetical protein